MGHNRRKKIYKILVVLFSFILISVVLVMRLVIKAGSKTHFEEVDYVVVLGAGLYQDRPSASLLTRLKVAHAYLEEYQNVEVVVSGGQGSGEKFSEAFVMKKYLTDHGVGEERIIVEDQSTNTFENLQFSIDKIREKDGTKELEIVIASNKYHIFRAKMLAKRLGITAYGLPAEIPPSIVFKSYVREYFALVKSLILDRPS